MNHEFDLFILESESTSLVEVSCLNKRIICLQREHPKILKSNYKQLKKVFCLTKKELNFKTIEHSLRIKKLKKFTKCSLLMTIMISMI